MVRSIKNILFRTGLLVAILFPTVLSAQNSNSALPATIYEQDTLLTKKAALDSSLVGRDVFQFVKEGGSITINQSASVEAAFPEYLKRNAEKKKNGYRIRIFFDNKQSARTQSEEIEKLFIEQFPQYPVYRTYTNPYFKVAVGDFRSKSDAVRVLEQIKREYPKAFIIKDVINYPL